MDVTEQVASIFCVLSFFIFHCFGGGLSRSGAYVLFPRRKSTKRALKGRGCFDSPSPLKKPHTRNDIFKGLRPSPERLPPKCCPQVPRRTTKQLWYSAATAYRSVSLAVRGAAAEAGQAGSASVPQLPKVCGFRRSTARAFASNTGGRGVPGTFWSLFGVKK